MRLPLRIRALKRLLALWREAYLLQRNKDYVRSIGGLSGDVNRELSQKVCGLLSQSLGVPPNRIYLNFTDVEASNWGWNGKTFG